MPVDIGIYRRLSFAKVELVSTLFDTWTCIEVGLPQWVIWQVNRKGYISATERISTPADNMHDPKTLAQGLGDVFGKKVLFLLNTSLARVRLSNEQDDGSDIQFPFEEGYIFSRTVMKDCMWVTALPEYISVSLVEMCRIKGIQSNRILAIDTLEYRMACYFGGIIKSQFWLLIPQEPGIRLIVLDEGVPCGCYFFSNDPNFRVKELTRIWHVQTPESAVILSDEIDYLWIREFLEEKSVMVMHRDDQDFKDDMIQGWVKGIS